MWRYFLGVSTIPNKKDASEVCQTPRKADSKEYEKTRSRKFTLTRKVGRPCTPLPWLISIWWTYRSLKMCERWKSSCEHHHKNSYARLYQEGKANTRSDQSGVFWHICSRKNVEAPWKKCILSHGSLLGKQRKTKQLVVLHPLRITALFTHFLVVILSRHLTLQTRPVGLSSCLMPL